MKKLILSTLALTVCLVWRFDYFCLTDFIGQVSEFRQINIPNNTND